MSKILLIGHSPPPYRATGKVEAAHYRTWQFLEPLLDAGHEISLCVPQFQKSNEECKAAQASYSLTINEFCFDRIGWVSKLQKIHDTFNPDCIVAVNFDACLYASKLKTSKPIWMDIYGDYSTIVQAACYRAKSDRGITTSISLMTHAYKKGDKFSVCSRAQEHMLVGELAMAGRLNWRTFGYQFVQDVLPGSPVCDDPFKLPSLKRCLLERVGISWDDFVILWCGGYNTWTDVNTLFKGMIWAMEQDPRVHFVSIGASTYDAPDNTYERFLALIEKSNYCRRFHMLGWRPWEEISGYYQESDVGINIDALHYETIYGTRTRLLEMMAAGLPVITSLGSEISYLIQDRGAGLGFNIGECHQLGQRVLELSSDPELCRKIGTDGYNLTHNELSFQRTTKLFCEWVKCPGLAPDKLKGNYQEKFANLTYNARAYLRNAIWRAVGLYK